MLQFEIFDSFFGEFSLATLEKFHLNTQIAYLLVVDDNLTLGVAVYPFEVFICDPLGHLSTKIPEQLSKFLFNNCFTNIYITSKICNFYILEVIYLFFLVLCETHSYKQFLSYTTDNYYLNEVIVRKCLVQRGIAVEDIDES